MLYFAFKVSVLVRLPGLSSIRWLPVCGLETLVSPALRVLKNLRPAVLQLFYYISDRFLEKVNKAMVLFVKNRGLRLWWCGQPLSCHFVHLCLWMCCGSPSGFKLPYIIYNLLYHNWWWWWLLWLPWSLNKNSTHLGEDIFRWCSE